MDNLDINELIERYLDGSLPPAGQEAVESRLAVDVGFRAEVELHRQLHEELADAQKLQLRDLLGDIVRQTPLSPPAAKPGGLKWLGIMVVAMLALWLGWRWFSPDQERPPVPAGQEEIKSIPPSATPSVVPPVQNAPSEVSEKAPEHPIAMADPADFAANREFEDRLGSVRAANGSAEMQSPGMGTNFLPQNGLVKINFRGTAPPNADTTRYPLALNIHSNQPGSEPLFRVLPTISNRSKATGQWAFSTAQRLRLSPGLYYFTVERQADEDIIFVGKFTVDKH